MTLSEQEYAPHIQRIEQEICEAWKAFEGILERHGVSSVDCQYLRQGTYFAGGCLYSLAHSQVPKDYDLWCDSQEIADFYAELPFWSIRTNNALTYGKYQVITAYVGKPWDVVKDFDFKHVMVWMRPYNILRVFDNDWTYLFGNTIVYNIDRARDFEGSYFRSLKFEDRGMLGGLQARTDILKKTTMENIHRYYAEYMMKPSRCRGEHPGDSGGE